MKRILISGNLLLMIAALTLAGCASVGNKKITAMNPAIASQMVDRIPLTNRLDSLEGKTIYFIDVNWGGPDAAYSVFEEMQAWLSKNMPSVKTVLKRKRGMYSEPDPQLWKEIGEKGDAAVIGISG